MGITLAKWTLQHYHQMIDVGLLDDCHVELLNGEIVEMAPEGEPHAYFSHESADYLKTLLGNRVTIRQGKPITIPDSNSEPELDLAIVQPLGREYLQHHPFLDNIFWLIEFAHSSLAKDTDIKRKIYAAANIPDYWVMDLKKRQLHVFRDPSNGDYHSEIILTSGEICPLAFPEISIAVRRLLDA